MKIIIEKFGPIEKFEYDLDKELIITYGNNNIGKSYAMQIVYLLLKTFIANVSITPYRQMYLYPHRIGILMPKEKIESMVRAFMESDEQIKDITFDIISEVNNLISSAFVPEFMNSCRNTFGNLEKTLEKNPLITIDYKEYNFAIELKTGKVNGTVNIKPVRLKKTDSDIHKSRNSSSHLDIYAADNIERPVDLVFEEIQKIFMRCVRLISDDVANVYFLPASRSGIYAGMNAFRTICQGHNESFQS